MKKALLVALLVGLLVTTYGVFAHQGYGMSDTYRNYGGDRDMDEMHDYMVSQVDPQTAEYMNQMHNACHYD